MPGLHEIIEKQHRTCGFAAASTVPFVLLEREQKQFATWLSQGYGADMSYLDRSADYRHDLRRLFPGVQSIVATLTSYRQPDAVQQAEGAPQIARFAWSDDYHDVIKRNLGRLLAAIQATPGFEQVRGRAVVDSAPAFERAWAVQAGLGWIGRSSMLIHPQWGSFTLIGLLLLDMPLPEDLMMPAQVPDRCGDCGRCQAACPTGAIVGPKTVDARRCLSYQTIERHGPVEDDLKPRLAGRIFGCDRCLEVCPYNDIQTPATEVIMPVRPEVMGISAEEWRAMTEDEFNIRFAGSPLLRAGLEKIRSSLP